MKTTEEARQKFDQTPAGIASREVKRLSRMRFQPRGLPGKPLHEHRELAGQFCPLRWRKVRHFR